MGVCGSSVLLFVSCCVLSQADAIGFDHSAQTVHIFVLLCSCAVDVRVRLHTHAAGASASCWCPVPAVFNCDCLRSSGFLFEELNIY